MMVLIINVCDPYLIRICSLKVPTGTSHLCLRDGQHSGGAWNHRFLQRWYFASTRGPLHPQKFVCAFKHGTVSSVWVCCQRVHLCARWGVRAAQVNVAAGWCRLSDPISASRRSGVCLQRGGCPRRVPNLVAVHPRRYPGTLSDAHLRRVEAAAEQCQARLQGGLPSPTLSFSVP